MANPFIPKVSLDHVTYPQIAPLPAGTPRPFWSVMIPTYNRPAFLRTALLSVLAQGYGPDEMQIMVVDNASTEADIEALVQEVGQGRVEYFRQAGHVGFARNWTTCIQQARGQWVQVMHDDAQVMPGFYTAYEAHIRRHGCPVIFSQGIAMDETGRWLGITHTIGLTDEIADYPYQIIAQWNTFYVGGLVVQRELYEQVGGYSDQIFYGCDHEMATRLFRATGRVGFLARPYILSSEHSKQGSSRYWREKTFNKGELLAWQLIIRDNALPESYIYQGLSKNFEMVSRGLLANQHHSAAWFYALWAFRLRPAPDLLTLFFSIGYVWWLKRPISQLGYFLGISRRVMGFVKRRLLSLLRKLAREI